MRQEGKRAALAAAVQAWVTEHGQEPAAVAWLVAPDGVTRWVAASQRWVPVPAPEAGGGPPQQA